MNGLKRELGLFETTLYGIGIILGAGIYALIGKGAGLAGNALWISFAIAAIIAAFTGLSYAELSGMYPKAAAEYTYAKNAFRKKAISVFVGMLISAAGITAAAAVSLGFAGYFSHMFGGPQTLIAALLVAILSVINYIGIKESARFNIIATLIEAGGLILVVIAGALFVGDAKIDYFEMAPAGFSGIMSAVGLIFFAYIGFENIANMSEEAKNPTRTIPKAIVLAIAISTILYMLVAVSSVSLLGWEKLASSKAPLTDAVSGAIPNAGLIMSMIALFATSNTILILLIVTSRIIYGISSDGSFPGFFSKVGERGTPYNAVLAVGVAAMLALLAGNIETVAMLTDLAIFVAYFFVNASLIWLRYKEPALERPFKVPGNIGNFPVLAFLGLVSCMVMSYVIVQHLLG